MKPFMEFVHPQTGHKQRVAWDAARSSAKREEFRAEARERFRLQDIQRARAVGIKIADDAVSLPTSKLNHEGNIVVDPLSSSVKHSGAEFDNFWIPKWQAFCCKPQNSEDAEYPTVTYKPQVAVVVDEPVADQPTTQEPDEVRRRPGRPRRRALANI